MMTPDYPDYRALCAELLRALENEGYANWGLTTDVDPLCQRARAALAQPEPVLPPNYIDAEHTGQDQELLKVFYKTCLSEGGTADEITLRGLKAALAQPAPAVVSVAVSDALIRAECALSDVAEGEPNCDDGDPAQWAEQLCAETLAIIRPVMKLHKIRTSEWPPQPMPTPICQIKQ